MAHKATHFGHCQICGRRQKLPGGKLAKHGYTTQWGFFAGTCPGSDNLPYEITCEMLPPRLENVNAEIEKLVVEANALKTADYTNETTAWVKAYEGSTFERKGRGYFWLKTEVTFDRWRCSYLLNGVRQISHLYDAGETNHSKILYLNSLYANNKIGAEIRQLRLYADWAKNRIADWKPAELTAI